MDNSPRSETLDRYSRQITTPEIGEEGQRKLKNARVLIVGLGGLGSTTAQFLAGAGVGTLGIADYQLVELTNLHRQPLYTEADIGKEKVDCAAKRLSAVNSSIRIISHHARFSVENAPALVSDYDLMIDGSDNFATKYLLNDVCVLNGRPFISASLYRFSGQVALFNAQKKGVSGPTYRCLFPVEPASEMDCDESGIVGPVAGLMANLQAAEAIKHICGVGETLSGKVLMIDVLHNTFDKFQLERRADAVEQAELGRKRRACSAAELRSRSISVEQLERHLAESMPMTMVDLREGGVPSELGGVRVPFSLLPAELDSLVHSIGDSKMVVMYCEIGLKSAAVLGMLQSRLPQATVLNLDSGLNGWRRHTYER